MTCHWSLRRSPATPLTEDVQNAIERALERRAEREAPRIHVDVRDGRAALTGTVHTCAERELVLAAARLAPGVRAVDDYLSVEAV
jgi:osmotically-inducible protein OsmY